MPPASRSIRDALSASAVVLKVVAVFVWKVWEGRKESGGMKWNEGKENVWHILTASLYNPIIK